METTLDPNSQPFLNDHRIDGTPVLPGVMGIEAFAEAALCGHPGWHVEAIEEVNFLAPFKFYKNEPRTLFVEAVFHAFADRVIADCRLLGKRILATQSELQTTTHFTARVRLSRQPSHLSADKAPRLAAETIVNSEDVYRVYFHGPAYQVVERAWWDGTHLIGEMSTKLPPNHQPSAKPTVMHPRLIELCFQTAGLWEMGSRGRMGLPMHVERLSVAPFDHSPNHLYALVTPRSDGDAFDAKVVDGEGNCYLQLDGYRTATLPGSVDAELLRPLHKLTAPEEALQHA